MTAAKITIPSTDEEIGHVPILCQEWINTL